MGYRPGDAFVIEFATSNASGAATNADSLPTALLDHNGSLDSTVTVTVANITTGRYKASGTIPSGYVGGDSIAIIVNATISSIAATQVVYGGPIDRLIEQLVWAILATTASVVGSFGLHFRQFFAQFAGAQSTTYPSASTIASTFSDADTGAPRVVTTTTLNGSGQPISRSVTLS